MNKYIKTLDALTFVDRLSEIRDLVEKGRFQEGLAIISTLPQQLLTIGELLLKVEVYRELGMEDEAFTLLNSLAELITNDEEYLQYKVEEAYLLYRNTKIHNSIKVLENLHEKFDSFASIRSYEAKIAFIKSYSLSGNLQWRAHNLAAMIKNYEIAFGLSQQLNHSYSIIHSLIGLGNASKEDNDPISAIAFYESGLFASIKANNLKFEAYCRNNLGEMYIFLGRIDEAQYELEQANQYFSDEGSIGPLSITSFNLGLCHYFSGRHLIAEKYFKFSLMLSEKVSYSYQIIDVFLYLIILKSSFKDYTELEIIYSDFLNLLIGQETEQFSGIKLLVNGIKEFNNQTLRNRAKALIILEKLLEMQVPTKYKLLALTYLIEIKFDEYRMYNHKEEFVEINKYFDQLQDLSGIGIHFELRSLLLQAKFNEIKGNFKDALTQLRKAIQLCKKYGLFTERNEILENIERINQYNRDQTTNPIEINQQSINHDLDLLRKNFHFVHSTFIDLIFNQKLGTHDLILHPQRFKIMRLLEEFKELSRSRLLKLLKIADSSFSRHIQELEQANLIESTYGSMEGKLHIIYKITTEGMLRLDELLN